MEHSNLTDPDALRKSEERLRLALEAGGSGAWDWDMEGDEAVVSASYRELFGIPADTPVTYAVWLSSVHPEDRERCRAYGEAFFAGRDTDWRLQFRVVTPHKGVRWHRAVGKVFRDDAGKPVRFIGVSSDITEEQRALDAQRESEERFRAMADGLPLIIWVHDADGAQEFVNHTFLEFFGVTEQEMKGGRWRALMHPDDAARYSGEFMRCTRERQPFHCETRVRNANGEWRVLESWARPRFSAGGEFLGMVGTSADVTERIKLEQARRDADRHKDEFLATLGHELRNPLAVLAAALDLFRLQLPADSPLQETRQAAQRQTRVLIRLVDDLLDSARVSTGKIHLQRARVALHAVVQAAIETCRPQLRARRHQLVIEESGEPLATLGDEVRLVQMLVNLLNNAVRYTSEGGRIVVSLERAADQAIIRVRDTGIGIQPEKLATVFELFVQESASGSASAGLGVGLALVKKLVELHGGSVEARSEGRDRGAEVIVRLPLAPDETASAVPMPATATEAAPKGQASSGRVLLVEDNPDGAESLARLLRVLGYEVRVAHDGAAALRENEEFRPQVVLLDIGLPDMDGYEVAQRIRARPGERPRIMGMSGHGERSGIALAAGMERMFVKPVDIAVLEQAFAAPPPR